MQVTVLVAQTFSLPLLMSQRTFRSPSGRAWTASLVELPRMTPADPARAVLRFASGDLALDLEDWPQDWAALTDGALVQLVRRANPPRLGLPGERALQARN